MTKDEALKLALEALENLPALNWIPEKDMQVQDAITAIKEALAQPEPVIDKSAAIRIATSLGWEPKRTWVGLTDEEIMDMYNEPRSDAEMIAFGREVEAKLKEKNT